MLVLLLLVLICHPEELAITKEFIANLKNEVSWEVSDYFENIFRGWSIEDIRGILGSAQHHIERTPTKKFYRQADDNFD